MGETCGSGNGKGPVDLFIHIRLISPIRSVFRTPDIPPLGLHNVPVPAVRIIVDHHQLLFFS